MIAALVSEPVATTLAIELSGSSHGLSPSGTFQDCDLGEQPYHAKLPFVHGWLTDTVQSVENAVKNRIESASAFLRERPNLQSLKHLTPGSIDRVEKAHNVVKKALDGGPTSLDYATTLLDNEILLLQYRFEGSSDDAEIRWIGQMAQICSVRGLEECKKIINAARVTRRMLSETAESRPTAAEVLSIIHSSALYGPCDGCFVGTEKLAVD